MEEVERTQFFYFTPEVFQKYYSHAQKEKEKYSKIFEALDTDTHVIAVQNLESEGAVTSSNVEFSAQRHDSARTDTEEKESSS